MNKDMTKTDKKSLMFVHSSSEGACQIGRILSARGSEVHTIQVPRMPELDLDYMSPDILVVMGGPIGVYQADDYPFLKREIEIVKERLDAGRPVIGICLGAQIIAAALGERVYKGERGMEVGWHKLEITPEGMNSPARHFAAKDAQMFHWHGDTFDLPKGAELWASSKTYKNQIYQYEECALGVQCHPEVRRERLKEWEVRCVSFVTGDNPILPLAQWRADTEKYIEDMNAAADLFFNEWLEARGL